MLWLNALGLSLDEQIKGDHGDRAVALLALELPKILELPLRNQGQITRFLLSLPPR
jgi:hypothetical protein